MNKRALFSSRLDTPLIGDFGPGTAAGFLLALALVVVAAPDALVALALWLAFG